MLGATLTIALPAYEVTYLKGVSFIQQLDSGLFYLSREPFSLDNEGIVFGKEKGDIIMLGGFVDIYIRTVSSTRLTFGVKDDMTVINFTSGGDSSGDAESTTPESAPLLVTPPTESINQIEEDGTVVVTAIGIEKLLDVEEFIQADTVLDLNSLPSSITDVSPDVTIDLSEEAVQVLVNGVEVEATIVSNNTFKISLDLWSDSQIKIKQGI